MESMIDPQILMSLVNSISQRYIWDNGQVIDTEHQGRWDREKLTTLHTVIQKATVQLSISHGQRGNVVLGSLPTIKLMSCLNGVTRSSYYGRIQENPILTCFKHNISFYASSKMSNNMLIVGCTKDPKIENLLFNKDSYVFIELRGLENNSLFSDA